MEVRKITLMSSLLTALLGRVILQKVNTNGSKNNPVKEEYYEDKKKKKIYTN